MYSVRIGFVWPWHSAGPDGVVALQWRHNGHDCISNHQPPDCLLNRLFGRRSEKIWKLRVTGLCVGNSPVTGEFATQMASNTENVSIWWRHCDKTPLSILYHFAFLLQRHMAIIGNTLTLRRFLPFFLSQSMVIYHTHHPSELRFIYWSEISLVVISAEIVYSMNITITFHTLNNHLSLGIGEVWPQYSVRWYFLIGYSCRRIVQITKVVNIPWRQYGHSMALEILSPNAI